MKYTSIIICIAAIIISSCKNSEQEEQDKSKYVVTSPITTDTTIYKDYVGQIRSIQHIELRALEKGYLQKIYVDEGQYVQKGQLLFQIQPIVYHAEKQKAQAEVSFADIEYQNAKALADSNIVSKNELALANAKLKKAQAELSLTNAHLNFTEIRAPFSGIIGRFNDHRLGSLIDEGELFTTLSDNSKMWVYFNVPEAEYLNYATKTKSDEKLNVKLDLANNQPYEQIGTVETIEADFNNETGNIAFRATFNNPSNILRNGETGNVLVPVELKNVLFIPQKATFEVLDKKYVYVVDKDGVLQTREIIVSTEIPHLYAVSHGLNNSDKVLVDGLRKVKNGQKIKYSFMDFHTVLKDLNQLHAE